MINTKNEIDIDNKLNSNLYWQNSPAAQKIIDVICQIIADEYVKTVKENPEIFSKG